MPNEKVDWGKCLPECIGWVMTEDNGAAWLICCPMRLQVGGNKEYWQTTWLDAPDFGYEGNWRDSLTMRPQE